MILRMLDEENILYNEVMNIKITAFVLVPCKK